MRPKIEGDYQLKTRTLLAVFDAGGTITRKQAQGIYPAGWAPFASLCADGLLHFSMTEGTLSLTSDGADVVIRLKNAESSRFRRDMTPAQVQEHRAQGKALKKRFPRVGIRYDFPTFAWMIDEERHFNRGYRLTFYGVRLWPFSLNVGFLLLGREKPPLVVIKPRDHSVEGNEYLKKMAPEYWSRLNELFSRTQSCEQKSRPGQEAAEQFLE